MTLFEEFEARGMIAQCTDKEAVEKLLENEKINFYIGFDPTADSLHIGHFMQMKVMSHMQRAGHHPIALMGGGTGMIGDPTGKNDMRKMMTRETIEHNIECFKKQMSSFLDVNNTLFVNNADWLMNKNYIEFLREIGAQFSVNRMLTAECYKSRMERGLTFLEFNYMIMQSYDFYHLYKEYGCKLEFGGDDQWSNIIGGVELIRKKEAADVYGLTFKLLLTSEGKKMGKTEKGALWLDPEKTTPYDFYQYWRNIDDADVFNCMRMITFMDLAEIAEYEKTKDSTINSAKERLAYEVTALIHGEENAKRVQEAARSVYGGSGISDSMPTTEFSQEDVASGSMEVMDMLVRSKLAPSRSEARRLIQQGGVMINDEKVSAIDARIDADELVKGIIVKKGKKTIHRIIVK